MFWQSVFVQNFEANHELTQLDIMDYRPLARMIVRQAWTLSEF